MYNTTNAFNEAILGDNRRFLAKIKYENTEITDGFVSIKHTMLSNSNNVITVGSAFSSYVEVEMWKPDITLERKEVEVFIGLEREEIEKLLDSNGNEILDSNGESIYTLNGNDSVEWVPLGLFTVQKPENDNGIIKFTAYDRIQSKMSGAYFSDLTYPTDAKKILAEIQEKTGAKIDTSELPDGVSISQREVISNSEVDDSGEQTTKTTYENPFNGYTYREALGYIAMLYAKFAIADRTGAIKFVWYSDIDYNINTDRYYDDLKVTETVFQVGKITCTGYNNTSYEAGSGNVDIQLNNPVMTQERMNYIYSKIKDIQFLPASTSFYGDIRLDVGDIVTVNSKEGNIVRIPIMNITHEYDGGLLTSIQSYGGSTEEEQTKGPTLERLERTYTELFMVKEIVGNKADFAYVRAKTGEFEEVITKKLDIEKLEAENAKLGFLTAKTAELKFATIDFANVKEQVVGSAIIEDGAITNAKIANATIEAAKIKSINADTITAGTISTKRLIITDDDGKESIVKAINSANGVTEADANGKKIQAASVDVADLSAFKATIAQFNLELNAIYSGKTSISDPASGIYISTTGIGVGNGELVGITESPVQIYSDGSIKLIGKNTLIDFNSVLGELNIEATNVKITSGTKIIDVANYVNESTKLIQNAQGWQLEFDKLIKTDEAEPEKHQNYITLQNGNVILGSSDSNIKLSLFNDRMLISDVDGTNLAQFEKNSVALGMDGTASIIDLCKGTGKIQNANPDEEYKRLSIISEDSVEISAKANVFIKSENDTNSSIVEVGTDQLPWNPNSPSGGAWTKMSTKQLVKIGDTEKYNEGIINVGSKDITISTNTVASGLTTGIEIIGDTSIIRIDAYNIRLSGNLIETNNHLFIPMGYSLRTHNAKGEDRQLLGLNNSNYVILGYGPYNAKETSTTAICAGDKIQFQLGKQGVSWRPYLEKGDSITLGAYRCAGYITNSGQDVVFSIPLDRPILSGTTIVVTSVQGLIVRQGNKYLYGSSSTTYKAPSSYSASSFTGGINVNARMPNTTNVVDNNDACGIQANIKITFS